MVKMTTRYVTITIGLLFAVGVHSVATPAQEEPRSVAALRTAVEYALSELRSHGDLPEDKSLRMDSTVPGITASQEVTREVARSLKIPVGDWNSAVSCPAGQQERFEKGCSLPGDVAFVGANSLSLQGDTATARVVTYQNDDRGRMWVYEVELELVYSAGEWTVNRVLGEGRS